MDLSITMSFGKHRGQPLSKIPPNCLLWVDENVDIKSPRLREAVKLIADQARDARNEQSEYFYGDMADPGGW